jgi:carbamoyl-phosphate synthase large subunit
VTALSKYPRPLFVTSDQSDVSVPTVAALSYYLRRPGNSTEAINRFTDKWEMYTYGVGLGLPMPESRLVDSPEQLLSEAQQLGLPVVVKPRDSQSSRGLSLITELSVELAEEAYQKAVTSSKKASVMLQKCVRGQEFTCEGVCAGSDHVSLVVSRKDYLRFGVPGRLCYPAPIKKPLEDRIKSLNDIYVRNSGLTFGLTHAEYIVEEGSGEVYLIEIAARGGGSGVASVILPWLLGFNPYDLLHQCLLGAAPDISNLTVAPDRTALLQFLEFPTGIVQISVPDEVKKLPLFRLNVKNGDIVKPAQSGAERHGLFTLLGHGDLEFEADSILNSLGVLLSYDH